MKLKTLKDIKSFKTNQDWWKNLVYKEHLKKEAIKWVNEIKDKDKPLDVVTFMGYFKITEEDLK